MNMSKNDKLETLLWSIAFPGFGQGTKPKIRKRVLFYHLRNRY